ncbi:rab3 gtpase-activating protein catalytic subunit [Anaeramoeba flamelloides]|uniref:Rab3 gtpase-activating protein catalytic subunit n=1 Tax=Anaeramoeba flamelloides TaxID=1746091 RepID=A0ABQ8XCT8_9EUKA|nr:rab3 gtpase-activating protein catalytic subunit [Anaeramoeba flamelloides]
MSNVKHVETKTNKIFKGYESESEDQEEEENENETPFVIHDFSVSTKWENFSSTIENILHKWELDSSKIKTREFEEPYQKEMIVERLNKSYRFVWKLFTIPESGKIEYPISKQMKRTSVDFEANVFNIRKYFGLDEALFIYPVKVHFVLKTASPILTSSILALDMCNSPIPIFIPIFKEDEKDFPFYYGYSFNNGVRTIFETEKCSNNHIDQLSLYDLLNSFSEKLSLNRFQNQIPIQVHSQFIYEKKFYKMEKKTQFLGIFPHKNHIVTNKQQLTKFFSKFSDPICKIRLIAQYDEFSSSVQKKMNFSDKFDPLKTKAWVVKPIFEKEQHCFLTNALKRMIMWLSLSYKLESFKILLQFKNEKKKKREKLIGVLGKIATTLTEDTKQSLKLPIYNQKQILYDLFSNTNNKDLESKIEKKINHLNFNNNENLDG